MTAKEIPIVFDVLGTLFHFAPFATSLQSIYPDLSAATATSLVDDWFHSAQRDFTYLSLSERYTPIAQILKASLPRVLMMNGFAPPDNLAPVLSNFQSLPARPGFVDAVKVLNGAKEGGIRYKLVAATNGGLESTEGLLKKALGEEEAANWEVVSCDEVKMAKPRKEMYERVWERLGGKNKEAWFVASHTWDLLAAKNAGFKTLFLSYEEHLPLTDIWGTPDLIASNFIEGVEAIIKADSY